MPPRNRLSQSPGVGFGVELGACAGCAVEGAPPEGADTGDGGFVDQWVSSRMVMVAPGFWSPVA